MEWTFLLVLFKKNQARKKFATSFSKKNMTKQINKKPESETRKTEKIPDRNLCISDKKMGIIFCIYTITIL